MDKVSIEGYLYSDDFEDSYLLASSSSSDSELECCCSDTDSLVEKLKRAKVEGFAEVSVPRFDDEQFKANFRVSRAVCEAVTELLYEDFCSEHKGGWERISPQKAAYVLLWFFASQETFRQISERFRITQSCTHNIVKVGCRNLSSRLDEYVTWPETNQYEAESTAFYDTCQFRGAIGAIGVSHVQIIRPKDDHEKYSNARNYHSVAVQGVVGSSGKFFDVHVCEGALSTLNILISSPISALADNGLLDGYFLLGTTSYPNLDWLVTPFRHEDQLTTAHAKFNERHNCASRLLNDTFARLKERFLRLNHLENKDVTFILQCVQTACVLHNICVELGDDREPFEQDGGIFGCDGNVEYEYCDDERRVQVFQEFCQL